MEKKKIKPLLLPGADPVNRQEQLFPPLGLQATSTSRFISVQLHNIQASKRNLQPAFSDPGQVFLPPKSHCSRTLLLNMLSKQYYYQLSLTLKRRAGRHSLAGLGLRSRILAIKQIKLEPNSKN